MDFHSKRQLTVGFALLLMSMTGCPDNGNLFGNRHKPGDSSDVRSLTSDAQAAYRNGDYSRALSYYNRILSQDPDNSQALLGASSAAIASSGLDLATLLSNVLTQSSVQSSISTVADVIAKSHVGGPVSAQGDILASINIDVLNQVIDLAVCRVQRIASGHGDGKISQNDLNLLVNYGVLLLIRAVVKAEVAGLLNITNNSGTYTIVSHLNAGLCDGSTSFGGIASQADRLTYLQGIAKDVAGAYTVYQRAVSLSNSTNNSVLSRLKDDLSGVNTDLLTAAGSANIPAECITTFSNGGIDVNNFGSYSGAFASPSGC